ncbi:MAG: hypothetical protein DRN04_15685 [Thermoprotei archaeon]|nr:MAG: hypothetical protein DRN04_15685 [Thermoprotei archaeon]
MNEPLVSIVIPTYNRKEKLERLIRSILESDYPKDKLEIIVVDDASTDGTYEHIKKLFPQVKVIRNDEEKLLAESRNIGIRASRGRYIFVIDDDNIIDKNTIKELVEFMEKHPEVGVAGPIMYFLNDPTRIWCAGVKRSYWTTITKLIGFNTRDNGRYKEPYESEDFPNAFITRREVFEKVGLLNSKIFPIHYDEGDFCQRARRAGYKVMVVPTAKVWHDIPLPERDRASSLHLKSPMRAYFATRNRILYHWVYSTNSLQRVSSLFFSMIIAIYYTITVLRSKGKNGLHIIKALLMGLIDGLQMIKSIKSYVRTTIPRLHECIAKRNIVNTTTLNKRQMQVAIVTRYFMPVQGGIENHCFNLAKKLLEQGIEVDIHTSKDTLRQRNVLKDYEILDGVKVIRHREFWRFIPKNYDVIHIHNFNIFPHFWILLNAFIIKKILKRKCPKIVLTPHGGFMPWWNEFTMLKRIIKKVYHQTIGRFLLNNAVDKVIALNEWEKIQLIKNGVDPKRIIVIPNGVEDYAYTLPLQQDNTMGKFQPYILFIGRISKSKNIDTVIKYLANLDNINFLIAGPIQDEKYYQYLIDLSKKLGVDHRVFFLGEVHDAREKYKLIDNSLAVVLLSYNETEPIVVKEAMARGKPVLVSSIPPLRSLVKNYENGFIVTNAKIFKKAIKVLMTNRDVAVRIARNNITKAYSWQWKNIVEKIVKVYSYG